MCGNQPLTLLDLRCQGTKGLGIGLRELRLRGGLEPTTTPSHEDLDQHGPDLLGPLGAGQGADQQGLFLVEVVGRARASAPSRIYRHSRDIPEGAQFVTVLLDEGANIVDVRHPQALGQLDVENAGFVVAS